MSVIVAEIVIVLLLIAANGLFAMGEIAIVPVRKTRLRKLAEQDDSQTGSSRGIAVTIISASMSPKAIKLTGR